MKTGFLRLPRRSLFLKICLWFWLTSAVVGLAMVALDRVASFFPWSREMPRALGTALRIYGSLAMDRVDAGDLKEIGRISAHMREETGIGAWLLDPSGGVVGGGNPSRDAQEMGARALVDGKQAVSVSWSKAMGALPMTAADGRRYVAVAEISRSFFMRPPKPPGPPHGPPEGIHPMGELPGPPHGPLPKRFPIGTPLPLGAARLAVFLLVSGLICAFLARHLTAPIVELRDATRRLASGDLSARMGKRIGRRGDELSDLSADFDAMAERIGTLITMQRQLLGDISHELRSPLARLNVALELARRQEGKDAEKALDRIGAEAAALNEMIRQVLTLTRLETGMEPLPGTPVDLAHIVRDVAENADFEATGFGRNVALLERTDCSTVTGEAELLMRAIENVVRNAIRYEPSGGTVEVRLRHVFPEAGASAWIGVRDHGPGVPDAEIPNLFRPFFRVSNARERETGGTGLGLAITARAVQLHNGTVRASNAPGGGLLVEITLPLRQPEDGEGAGPGQSKSE